MVDRCAARHDRAEQRHAADQLDLAGKEAGAELIVQISKVIVGVVDHAQMIQKWMYQAPPGPQRDPVTDQGVTEYLGSGPGQGPQRIEDPALTAQVTGQTVDDAAERNRIERTAGKLLHQAQDISQISAWPIAR